LAGFFFIPFASLNTRKRKYVIKGRREMMIAFST